MKKIIIVEDAERIRLELTEVFERYGYEVKVPDSFDNVLDFVKRENADLIILDINLPIFDGYYLCREIRKSSDIPIIIVTSRDSDMDELMSINLGADDFITKPYNIEILLARANSLIRRSSKQSSTKDKLNYNDLEINLYNSSMTYKNNNIELTKNELKILIFLVRNKGVIVSREELMEHLWNDDFFVDNSTLSVNVTRLRKKLVEIGLDNAIETRRGQGYIMP
ncbi:response regulator transcription factor [Clostridium mediterraneense]|uniref:response regulator transcription factor n=1 Tax=Clostridium mediterraneense TaxID=1805472 RepID=UPI00082A4387|nr:response regulator transcription factor [Clostridium mediterraneense]